jgi:hypothetical protein
MIPGNKYVVSCWAKVANDVLLGRDYLPVNVQFLVSSDMAPLVSPGTFGWAFSIPATLPVIWNLRIDTTADRDWRYYSDTVVYSGPVAHRLAIATSPFMQPYSDFDVFYFIDDVSIKPYDSTVAIILPDTLCVNNGAIDLTTTVGVLGGSFRWYTDSAGNVIVTDTTLFDPAAAYSSSMISGDSGQVQVCYSYTVTGCSNTVCKKVQIINYLITPVLGALSVCIGENIVLSHAEPDGKWTSGYTGVATIDTASGTITPVSEGTATITYAAPVGCVAITTVTVYPAMTPITGEDTVAVGASIMLGNATIGGVWGSSTISIGTVDAVSGIVTGIAPGTVIISYTAPSGCMDTALVVVNSISSVTDLNMAGVSMVAIPNPTSGTFMLYGVLSGTPFAGRFTVQVLDLLGREIYSEAVVATGNTINKKVVLPQDIPSGIYQLKLTGNTVGGTIRVKIEN